MSRSALDKQFLRQSSSINGAFNPALIGVHPPIGIPLPPGYVDPNLAAVGYIAPIIGGDDEEYEDPQNKRNALPIHGNSNNFNVNTLLFDNIMQNDYFRALYQLRTYHEVIGEIQRSVKHVEPWQQGTSRFPSSAFCLLVKFFVMRLTTKQMTGLLSFKECPFVRAIGFLYLRYTCPPADLWKWYEPYLEDVEEIRPAADKNIKFSIGSYCIKLLTEMQYFGTTLPRIPVPIERKLKVFLLLLEEKKKRRNQNLRLLDSPKNYFSVGASVLAIYSDEENEPAWYAAVIDSVDSDAQAEGKTKFWVTFTEYGNSESVDIGDMKIPDSTGGRADSQDRAREKERARSRSRDRDRDNKRRDSRDRGGDRERRRDRDSRDRDGRRDNSRDRQKRTRRSPSRSRSRDSRDHRVEDTSDLMQKVIQSQREASLAVGKNYGQRPTSYKGSLSLRADTFTARRKSPSRDDTSARRFRGRSRSPSPPRAQSRSIPDNANIQSYEAAEKMKQLKAKYGDA